MTKTAILYARVSTEDQATDDKTSLSEQLRAMRLDADANGFDIRDEVAEDISGRKRNTPGLDKIRDLAEAGDIDAVMVYKWNRLARKAAKQDLFIMEMKMAGVDVIALDGQSNKTHSGRAMNRMMAVFSEYQRDDLVETMRQGKRGQARKGKIMPGRYAPYSFVYDSGSYWVDEQRMNHVRRLFRMVGTEGKSMRAVKKAFDREGVPTPGGGRYWHAGTIREMIQNDVYRAHTHEEVKALSPDAAAGLDPHRSYGIQWYNRTRWEHDTDVGDKKHHVAPQPEEEHIAVPVPDAGIPREWVEAARAAIKDNVRPSKAANRDWELKGILYCPCGCRLSPSNNSRGGKSYRYYACTSYRRNGPAGCEHGRYWPADKLEQQIREFAWI